ncbi:MAG: hypothetical protein ACI9QC_000620 [Oceanicoccus sp.]|jgi:hypothetical protein
MQSPTPHDIRNSEAKKDAHYCVIAERTDTISLCERLLEETDKAEVLKGLKSIRIGGQGIGFPEGFDDKDLSEMTEMIPALIEQLEAENAKVGGLVSAIKKGLTKVSQTPTEAVETYETELEPAQAEWVREHIEAGYERSKVVNAPLLRVEGVPAFPEKEAVLKSALEGLTKKQVEFMMQEGRSPFTLQVKAVGPSSRLDLVEKLLDRQPKKMSIPNGESQQDLTIWSTARQHMSTRISQGSGIVWKWDFYQSEQIIGTESWDDITLAIEDRLAKYRTEWEKAGMRGTDRSSWATAMADGLESGKPLDIRFTDDATTTEEYEEWNATILDEEGELTDGGYRHLVGGCFDPYDRYAYLNGCNADVQGDSARFRASCDGVIKA